MQFAVRCWIGLSLIVLGTAFAEAQLTSPQIGWQAELSTVAHKVSGTVNIVDEDTLRFDDFTYDGGGLSVFFYLGTEDSRTAFSAGLSIGEELLGMVFDGTQDDFFVDLPEGKTLEGYHAISVWCVTAGANFGSGTFMAVEPPFADYDNDADVDAADFLKWQQGGSPSPLSAEDLGDWQATYGSVAVVPASFAVVPEPCSALLLLLSFGAGRSRFFTAAMR